MENNFKKCSEFSLDKWTRGPWTCTNFKDFVGVIFGTRSVFLKLLCDNVQGLICPSNLGQLLK